MTGSTVLLSFCPNLVDFVILPLFPHMESVLPVVDNRALGRLCAIFDDEFTYENEQCLSI
jgi:hypothetical protein